MSATDPDDAVANYLAAGSPAPSLGTVGSTIFRGPVRPPDPPRVSHAAIFVLATGGPPPDDYFQWAVGQPSVYRSNVQIRIRSNADDFGDGLAVAQAVQNKLHLAQLDQTGAIGCKVLSSSPIYLGRDDGEHHEWSINASVWFER